MKFTAPIVSAAVLLASWANPALAGERNVEDALAALEARIAALENENRTLQNQLRAAPEAVTTTAPPPVAASHYASTPAPAPAPAPAERSSSHADGRGNDSGGFVGTNSKYAYRMLDHAENITTRNLVQLEAISSGELKDRVTLSGGTTVLINQQWSNRTDKFGYLMRHPTSANQVTKSTSEAVIHSAQLAITARLSDDFSSYAELLYDPSQSFGQGTLTALARNQIQLRRGWVMYGNLNKSPLFALVGKMDVPFGLNDTVSPFTNSTNWHAFAGLAYGAQAGIKTNNLLIRGMAVQGGAQFRAANTPVNKTGTPSKLNNFAVDARYTMHLDNKGNNIMAGASYIHGSPYCQSYPVVHFNPCTDNNPAWSAYGKVEYGPLTVLGEFARTTKTWPGSAVPIPTNPLSRFAAKKTESFTFGARLGLGGEADNMQRAPFAVSAEFSKFIAGADGAPWQRQNQAVLGLSWFAAPSVNLFSEFTHVDGYAPLNFVSGGNFDDGSSWSDRDAKSNVAMFGAQIAF